MRGLMGTFAAMPLPDLVEFLARRATTGSLVCERGAIRKTIYLRGGTAIEAASNDPREFLGALLVSFGHLGEDQLAKAFRTQEETRVRLGKVLVMVGLVTPGTVRDVLAIKIRETLLDAFTWDSGIFHVDDAPPPAPDELYAEVPLVEIAREAEFRATAWAAFRGVFQSGAVTLAVDGARAPPAAAGSVDERVFALAQQGKTIDEIGSALRVTDFHLYQRLYALHRQGVVAPAAVAEASPVPTELLDDARRHLATGRHAEAEAAATRAADLAPGLAAAAAVLADARRILSAQLRAALLDPPRIPELRVARDDIARLRLTSAEKVLLARCDGRRDVRAIAEVTPLAELEVLKAFDRLVRARLVELR